MIWLMIIVIFAFVCAVVGEWYNSMEKTEKYFSNMSNESHRIATDRLDNKKSKDVEIKYMTKEEFLKLYSCHSHFTFLNKILTKSHNQPEVDIIRKENWYV